MRLGLLSKQRLSAMLYHSFANEHRIQINHGNRMQIIFLISADKSQSIYLTRSVSKSLLCALRRCGGESFLETPLSSFF